MGGQREKCRARKKERVRRLKTKVGVRPEPKSE